MGEGQRLVNTWGPTIIGVALVIGLRTRVVAAAGAALVALYYAARPAMIVLPPVPGFGSAGEMIVVLVEAARWLRSRPCPPAGRSA